MPRYPLDRRERAGKVASRDILEGSLKCAVDPYKHGMSLNHPPFSDVFAGRECTFVFSDGAKLEYKFIDQHKLAWYLPGVGGGWQETYYECYETSAPNLYFMFHEKVGAMPPAVRVFAIDMDNNKITMLYNCQGGDEDYELTDVSITPYFGYVDWHDGAEPPKTYHDYTTEMVRKVVLWRVNTWCLIHYYTSKHFFTNQVMIGQDGLLASEPARHIKLRDNVYFFHWLEVSGPGGLGCDVMDFNNMKGVGMFYGVGPGSKVCNGFQREDGKFLTKEDLLLFEKVFEEKGERAAIEAMGVNLSDCTTNIIHV
jgi:hypothetical protein